MRRREWIAMLGALWTGAFSPGLALARAHALITVVARSGDVAPGGTAGATFTEFSGASFSPGGRIGFRADLSSTIGGSSTRIDEGAWVEDASGAIRLVAKSGDPAPGAPGQTFGDVNALAFDDRGDVAISATLSPGVINGSSGSRIGAWGPDGAGGLRLLAGAGTPIPGISPSAQFSGVGDLRIDDAGRVVFKGSLNAGYLPGGGFFAIWGTDDSGILAVLAANNSRVTPTAPDLRGDLILSPLQFNRSGQLLFMTHEGRLVGPAPGNALATLAEPHDPLPGIPDSDLWIRPSLATGNSELGFNDRGEAAYPGWLWLAGNDDGAHVIVGPDATGAPTIRCDDATPLPGAPEGFAFSSFADPLLNNARDLVFAADFDYPTEFFGLSYMDEGRGYWILDESGAVQVLAVAGAPMPKFSASFVVSDVGHPALNESGQVVAFATMRSTDEYGFRVYGSALVFADRRGRRGVLLRAGDTVVVAPDDRRTVAGFDASNASAIRFPTLDLDDRGRALFIARFTDGSSALLLATIPPRACGLSLEPLLAFGLFASARRIASRTLAVRSARPGIS